MILYYCQYYFAKLLLDSNNLNSPSLFIIFFFLGVITIFTPCFLSILPLGLSYLSVKNNSWINILFFILGLLTSFFLIILSFNTVNMYTIFNKLPVISSFFTIIIALDLMNIINLSKLYLSLTSYLKIFNHQNLLIQNYLTGLIVGFSSLPCNTSILFIVVFLINNIHNTFRLFLYLLIYSVGLIIPLFMIFSFRLYSLSLNFFSNFWNFIAYYGGSFLFISSLISVLKVVTS